MLKDIVTAIVFSSVFFLQLNDAYAEKLSQPISNNAVAVAIVNGERWAFSFNGLKANKTHRDVSRNAFAVNIDNAESKVLAPVPFADKQGVLASVAVTVNNKIYIFGGYTVAQDGSEVSRSEVFEFNPTTEQYSVFTQIQKPVDDSVALVYKNRYVYLVSGWHNHGNVQDVQILDVQKKQWHTATDFPGEAVFGHGAGIVGNKFLVVDGVGVKTVANGKRQFGMANQSYLGEIDPNDIRKINWTRLPDHPGKGRYRMAVAGDAENNRIVFVGGSDNPYNFNGIGYNGQPSNPASLIFAWELDEKKWVKLGHSLKPTMDHRGLIIHQDKWITLGGMAQDQSVINGLTVHN